jgi:hypothetical protein
MGSSFFCLWGQTNPPPLFFMSSSKGLGARGHKPSNPKRQKAPFRVTRLMLVAPVRAPSAYRDVQLRRLEARGHKSNPQKRQRAPFVRIRLMLVASDQSASAFLHVQLRRVVPRGHKSRSPKRQKAAFSATSPYACRA